MLYLDFDFYQNDREGQLVTATLGLVSLFVCLLMFLSHTVSLLSCFVRKQNHAEANFNLICLTFHVKLQ